MSHNDLELKIIRSNRVWSNLSADQIRQWRSQGRVRADDLVRPMGSTRWIKVSLAPELAEEEIVAAAPVAAAVGTTSTTSAETATATANGSNDDLGIVTPANRRPRKKRRKLEDSALDMMPMIDVTFQLLIFFMFTQQLADPNPIEVPQATHGRGVMPDGKQAILIDQQGLYYLGAGTKPENQASLDELVSEVAATARAADAPLEVIISAHKNSVHRPARDLIERLSEIDNMGPVRLGVEEKQ